jgi:hypothetical protein
MTEDDFRDASELALVGVIAVDVPNVERVNGRRPFPRKMSDPIAERLIVTDPAQEGNVPYAESAKKSLDYVAFHGLGDETVTLVSVVFKHLA